MSSCSQNTQVDTDQVEALSVLTRDVEHQINLKWTEYQHLDVIMP